MLIWKSGTRSCGFYRFYLLWNWPYIYVCQESIMSQPRPLSVHQKHLKGKKSWERGWVIRFFVWLSPFDWNFYRKDGLFLSPQYTQGNNNRQKHSGQDRFVDEQTWMKWKYGWHVWSHLCFFFTILLMYIYRNATKVQVKIELKTSLEHILSTMILILINLPRYLFFILVYLLVPVGKYHSVKLRFI